MPDSDQADNACGNDKQGRDNKKPFNAKTAEFEK